MTKRSSSTPRNLSLILGLLSLLPHHTLTQDNNSSSLPPYVGPKPCPHKIAEVGYTDSTTLHHDMIHDAQAFTAATIDDNNQYEMTEHLYTLCPGTVFNLGYELEEKGLEQTTLPLIPLLSRTIIKCGEDGRLDNNCVFKGGKTQVHFFDFLITEVVFFMGITFEDNEGVAIYGSSNTFSSAIFKECLVKNNRGFNAIQIYFDGDMSNRRYRNRRRRQRRQRVLKNDDELSLQNYNDYIPPHLDRTIYTNLISARQYNNASFLSSGKTSSSNTDVVMDDDAHAKNNIYNVSHVFYNADKKNDNDDYYGYHHHHREGQEIMIRGMVILLFATDIIDNIQEKSAIMNIGGIVEIIDSDVSYNEVGFATIANLYGGRLYMHTNVTISNNYDQKGPVFIDKKSTLYLNERVTGYDNRGSGCDIFLELDSTIYNGTEERSNCLLRDEPCAGDCCRFGDTSCDVMTDAPSSVPFDEKDEMMEEREDEDDDDEHGDDVILSSAAAESDARNYASDESKCGAGCITVSVFIGMVWSLLFIAFVRRYREWVDRSWVDLDDDTSSYSANSNIDRELSAAAEAELQPNDNAVQA